MKATWAAIAGLGLSILTIAFSFGSWRGEVDTRLHNMSLVGGVPISTEAKERIGKLEAKWDDIGRRLERIERKLDAANGQGGGEGQ